MSHHYLDEKQTTGEQKMISMRKLSHTLKTIYFLVYTKDSLKTHSEFYRNVPFYFE